MTINEFMYAPYAIALAQLDQLSPLYGKLPPISSAKRLDQWEMDDDAPIFQFLYQAHQPRRHLEFDTWQGRGTSFCLESCPATVWTISLPNGEDRSGTWAYGECVSDSSTAPQGIVTANFGEDELGDIGRIYRKRGVGP